MCLLVFFLRLPSGVFFVDLLLWFALGSLDCLLFLVLLFALWFALALCIFLSDSKLRTPWEQSSLFVTCADRKSVV